jgi:hypothetical protein
MKKFGAFLMGGLVAAAAVFTGCSKDEEAKAPSIELLASSTQNGAEVAASASLPIKFNVTKGDATVKSVVIRSKNVDVATSAKPEEMVQEFTVTAPATGSQVFTIVVTDKDGLTASKDIKVTVKGGAVVGTDATLVHIKGAGKSYFSFAKGVLSQDEAKAAKADVDMVFFYGTSNKATLAAPNSTLLAGYKASDGSPIMTYLGLSNATKFDGDKSEKNMLAANTTFTVKTVGGVEYTIVVKEVKADLTAEGKVLDDNSSSITFTYSKK